MKRQLTTLILIGIVLAACSGNATSAPEPQIESVPTAWIDSPLDGSTFPLGEIEIISHTTDLSGIARVELSANGEVVRTDENPDSSLTLFVISQPWTPSQPGEYLIQVRGQTTGGEWSNYAQVNITVLGVTATPTTVPTETPIPTLTLTPTPVAPPTLTLTKNAFCRKGPNTAFTELTAIPAGDTVDILNISSNGLWYFVFWQKFNAQCWVTASSGNVSGNLSGVAVEAGPTLPPGLTSIAPTAPACTLVCPSDCQPDPTCTVCQTSGGSACKP
ncbi:MAG: Ig-like domain-containing protein [Chloroflexi bacterium]|nr:Ig-like domain-containing protein [Chloroflexota bacterium]